MKQQISYRQANISEQIKTFIDIWKARKGYSLDTLTIGECLELLIAITTNLHFEYSDGRFFNKLIINNESSISWDGDELLDILFFELTQSIQRLIARAQTFNEEIV